jgi:TupA-like ATPgrasp
MLKALAKKLRRGVVDRLPDWIAVRLFYFHAFGRFPNLAKPLTFNEKIAWRKLYQPNARFKLFADKLAAKAEIARIVGEDRVIKTLWSGEDPDNIPYDTLTPPYVIKTNHGYGGHFFIYTRADIDKATIAATLREGLARSHAHHWREWGYLGISPKILIEEMLVNDNGEVQYDYKFFVYHGRVHFIQAIYSRYTGIKRNFYDRDWVPVPVEYEYPSDAGARPPPKRLSELMSVAETIGAEFDFARVDLYETSAGVKVGELTFYPVAGVGQFRPYEWDRKFGEPWVLPAKFSSN